VVRITWTRRAQRDIAEIRAYIGQFAPLAAQRFSLRLVTAVESLAANPQRGRALLGGRRELTTIPPYLIRYRISGDTIEIITIRHGARRVEQN